MSGDESDDELEEGLRSPANEALERLRARERPTEEDVKLAEPYYQKLADQQRVPFLVVRDGFILGSKLSLRTNLVGYDYLRRTLHSATRTHRSDRYISAAELDSEGAVGDGGMLYSPDPEDYFEGKDDYDSNDWEAPYQQSEYEGVIEPSTRNWMINEKEKLEARGETPETNKTLAFCIKELGLTTNQGRIKSADPEDEKVRQRVWQAVEYVYEDMEGEDTGTKELRWMAAYFRKYVKRGRDYSYTGKIKFRFS